MLQFILLLIATAFAAETASVRNERIVNGENATHGELPFIVSFRLLNDHNCGGSILDKYHILTAAHCVVGKPLDVFSIQYNVTEISLDNVNSVNVANAYVHPLYAPAALHANDIAVLRLEKPLSFDRYVKCVKLPKQDEKPPVTENAVVAGWGKSQIDTIISVTKHLQKVTINLYSDEECVAANCNVSMVSKYSICAGTPKTGKGACNGDSGGPLLADNKQVGIVSRSEIPCGATPAVYTRVSRYINWINDIIKKA